jgi:hypothetical protein
MLKPTKWYPEYLLRSLITVKTPLSERNRDSLEIVIDQKLYEISVFNKVEKNISKNDIYKKVNIKKKKNHSKIDIEISPSTISNNFYQARFKLVQSQY